MLGGKPTTAAVSIFGRGWRRIGKKIEHLDGRHQRAGAPGEIACTVAPPPIRVREDLVPAAARGRVAA